MQVRLTFFNNFNHSILFIHTLQEDFFLLHFLADLLILDGHFLDYIQQNAVFTVDLQRSVDLVFGNNVLF